MFNRGSLWKKIKQVLKVILYLNSRNAKSEHTYAVEQAQLKIKVWLYPFDHQITCIPLTKSRVLFLLKLSVSRSWKNLHLSIYKQFISFIRKLTTEGFILCYDGLTNFIKNKNPGLSLPKECGLMIEVVRQISCQIKKIVLLFFLLFLK